MKNKFILVFGLILYIFSFKSAYAQDICSKNGYSIITINGIYTNDIEARDNKENLKKRLPLNYKNEPVSVDYVYNATHLAGFGDLVDAVRQGLFDSKSDYDLVEMLDSASEKIKTQKILIVGYSQGNFYANNFYDKIADKEGGVPALSLGVYSVASPDDHVSGGGKYLTSDTDTVIAAVVGRLKNILKPNDHIELKKEDGNGHSFSNVYLKYRRSRIVSDIKSSFDKLKINNIQNISEPCISTQEISTIHKITGSVLAVGDFMVNNGVKVSSFVFNSVKNTIATIVNPLFNITKKGFALIGLVDGDKNENEITQAESEPPVDLNTDNNVEKEKTVVLDTEPKDTDIIDEQKQKEENIEIEKLEEETLTADIKKEEEKIADKDVVTSGGGGGSSGGNNDSSTTVVTEEKKTEPEIVVPDINAPIITLNGESVVDLEINAVYGEEGATAIDDIDGSVVVAVSGVVDNTKLGANIITYTAIDKALNASILIRTVNIVNSNPIVSLSSSLKFPSSDIYKDDGLDIPTGTEIKKDFTVFNFQVIYTNINNNPPSALKINLRENNNNEYSPSLDMIQIEKGNDVLSDGDYANGELFIYTGNYSTEGYYKYSFTSFDKNGDYFKIENNKNLYFIVRKFDHFYIPRNTFGKENGDGKDWQMWVFNGANVYDWHDSYVNKYLHQQYKIEVYTGGFWCSNCIQMGIFKSDPKLGFDTRTISVNQLNGNPQNLSNGINYVVDIQWDDKGYSTIISHGGTIDHSSHTDVPNMNNGLWVGWDGSQNRFTKFPSGSWIGTFGHSKLGLLGGQDMMITPYPVYDENAEDSDPGIGEVVLSSEKSILSVSLENFDPKIQGRALNDNAFVLEVPYGTDTKNLAPTISISEKATITPASLEPQDFSNTNIPYRVKAEDGSIKDYAILVTFLPQKSSEKFIKNFIFETIKDRPNGVIDNTNHTVKVNVSSWTDVTNISPTIYLAEKATISPGSFVSQDFTNPVLYTVTAEDGSTAVYTVTVDVISPPVDTAPPYVFSYKINGGTDLISTNPIQNNMDIFINASEEVNWMSVKIEKTDDTTSYKMFRSDSSGCRKGTDVCSKVWDGTLSSGGILKNGEYKIRVHMQDAVLNDYEDYLPIIINITGQEY